MVSNLQQFKQEGMEDSTLFRAFVNRKPNGTIKLYLQSTEEIEKFFKTEETGESNQWKNNGDYHNFYMRQYEKNGNTELAEYFSNKYDKFGNNYVKDGRINLALLRTVGLSDGVEFEIPEKYSEDTIKESVESLKDMVEEIFKKFIRPVNVVTVIRVEEI